MIYVSFKSRRYIYFVSLAGLFTKILRWFTFNQVLYKASLVHCFQNTPPLWDIKDKKKVKTWRIKTYTFVIYDDLLGRSTVQVKGHFDFLMCFLLFSFLSLGDLLVIRVIKTIYILCKLLLALNKKMCLKTPRT